MYKAVQMDDGSIKMVHHGIKGQKWGERRYQYENGSLTPEGRERYLKDKKSGDFKSIKKQAKIDYKIKKKELNEKEYSTHTKYDRKKEDDLHKIGYQAFGPKGDLIRMNNEYDREKELNKIDQKRLDAKREYRMQLGKKKVDTLFMKIAQSGINDIASKSREEFAMEYVKEKTAEAIRAYDEVKRQVRGEDDW